MTTMNPIEIRRILTTADDDQYLGLAESSGYGGGDFRWEATRVGDVMAEHFDSDFAFNFESNAEGYSEYVSVGVGVSGGSLATYLSQSLEIKYCTDDRDATGMDAAVAIWTALERPFREVQRLAALLGVPVSHLRPGDRVIVDGSIVEVVSIDNDHRSTTIEFNGGRIVPFANTDRVQRAA